MMLIWRTDLWISSFALNFQSVRIRIWSLCLWNLYTFHIVRVQYRPTPIIMHKKRYTHWYIHITTWSYVYIYTWIIAKCGKYTYIKVSSFGSSWLHIWNDSFKIIQLIHIFILVKFPKIKSSTVHLFCLNNTNQYKHQQWHISDC